MGVAVGITFAVIFGLGTLGCLIGLGTISPAALGAFLYLP